MAASSSHAELQRLLGAGQLPPRLQRQHEIQAAADAERQRDLEAAEADRLRRARWVAAVADELLGGSAADLEARLFVGHALRQRVHGGANDIERLLGLRPPRGSKRTAATLLARAETTSSR